MDPTHDPKTPAAAHSGGMVTDTLAYTPDPVTTHDNGVPVYSPAIPVDYAPTPAYAPEAVVVLTADSM